MELARVMSQYDFDKTLVFVTFAGEEQGLIGATLQATKARKENVVIEAVLNNDIIAPTPAATGASAIPRSACTATRARIRLRSSCRVTPAR